MLWTKLWVCDRLGNSYCILVFTCFIWIKVVIFSSLSSYQTAINHLHELVMDQPMHPVDRATWWMEYLIRHPNPDDSMRSPAVELLWWQYLLIDVMIFLVIIVISFIIVVKFLFNFFCCRNKNARKAKTE